MNWNNLVIDLMPYMEALVIALIAYLFKYLATKVKNEKIQNLLTQTQNIVNDCVRATNNTFVNELKQNGKFTEAMEVAAFSKTWTAVQAILGTQGLKLLESAVGDVETYLTSKINGAVEANKKVVDTTPVSVEKVNAIVAEGEKTAASATVTATPVSAIPSPTPAQ